MANVFGKIRERLRRRAARRQEARVEARPEARPEEESNISLRRRLNERLNMYIREADVIRENYDLNPNEADRILEQYDNAIDILNICNRENELGIVSAFPVNDNDINVITYNYLSSNGVDPNTMQLYRAEEWYSPDTMARMRNTNPPLNPQQERARQSAIYSNMPLPRTPEEYAEQRARYRNEPLPLTPEEAAQRARQLNPDNQRNSNVRHRRNPVARGNMNRPLSTIIEEGSENNQPTNQVQAEAAREQQRQEQVGNLQPNGGREENNQATNQVQEGAAGQQQGQEQGEIAQPDAGRARNSTQGDHRNSPRVARVQHDNAGRPEQRISTVEPNVMDNNSNNIDIQEAENNNIAAASVHESERNSEAHGERYHGDEIFSHYLADSESENNSIHEEVQDGNSTDESSIVEDPPRVDILNNNGAESGRPIQADAVREQQRQEQGQGEATRRIVNSSTGEEIRIPTRGASLKTRNNINTRLNVVSSADGYRNAEHTPTPNASESNSAAQEEADVNDSVSSYQEQENVRDVTSENYSDRRVSSSFDSSIVLYDASNSLDTSTTSYDTRSSLGTSTTSYDTSSSLDFSYISYDRSSSLDSSYFSSDRSHNPESNTGTYSRNSSESNSARRNSSQLVKNDSYQQTNNRNNQRRHNPSF